MNPIKRHITESAIPREAGNPIIHGDPSPDMKEGFGEPMYPNPWAGVCEQGDMPSGMNPDSMVAIDHQTERATDIAMCVLNHYSGRTDLSPHEKQLYRRAVNFLMEQIPDNTPPEPITPL